MNSNHVILYLLIVLAQPAFSMDQKVGHSKERIEAQKTNTIQNEWALENTSVLDLGLHERKDAEEIVGPNLVTELEKNKPLLDDLEFRSNYDQVEPIEEAQQIEIYTRLGKRIVPAVVYYQLTKTSEKAEKQSPSVRTFQAVRRNLNHAQAQVKVANNLKFGTQASVSKKTGQVWMESKWVNSDFKADFGTPPPVYKGPVDPWKKRVEKYSVRIWKQLPFWNLGSNLSYGLSSTNVTATLEKPIFRGLTALLASRHAINNNKAKLEEGGEEKVALNYNISF